MSNIQSSDLGFFVYLISVSLIEFAVAIATATFHLWVFASGLFLLGLATIGLALAVWWGGDQR